MAEPGVPSYPLKKKIILCRSRLKERKYLWLCAISGKAMSIYVEYASKRKVMYIPDKFWLIGRHHHKTNTSNPFHLMELVINSMLNYFPNIFPVNENS